MDTDTDTPLTEMAASAESAHTSSHKSAPPIRMDLRGERRRRWTTEQKHTIAAQSLAPGASPTNVARLHGISTGQLYMWRQALKAAQPGAAAGRFARVEVSPLPVAPPEVPARPPGLIEIALSDGTTRVIRRLPSRIRPTRHVWRDGGTEQFLLASLPIERFRRGWMHAPAYAMVPGEPDA